MEVVVKPAASAASRKTKSRAPRSREAPRRPPSWSPGFGLPGGCASGRLDHGFQMLSKTMQGAITRHSSIQITFFCREIQLQGEEKALERVPGPRNAAKITNFRVLAPLELVTLITLRSNSSTIFQSPLHFPLLPAAVQPDAASRPHQPPNRMSRQPSI